MTHQVLTIPEAAARLRLSEARVRQLIAEGILPRLRSSGQKAGT